MIEPLGRFSWGAPEDARIGAGTVAAVGTRSDYDALIEVEGRRLAQTLGLPHGVVEPAAERFAEAVAAFVAAWVEGGADCPRATLRGA